MPISGLVLTLTADDELRQTTISDLRQHPAVELGELQEDRLPIVTDSPDDQADRVLWDWLQTLPGVLRVEVALIHFEDLGTGGGAER